MWADKFDYFFEDEGYYKKIDNPYRVTDMDGGSETNNRYVLKKA